MSLSREGRSASAVREILREYLAATAAGASPAPAGEPPLPAETVFVDAFAGAAYRTPPRTPAETRPLADLLRALGPAAAVVFLEEDPAKVGWLRDALAALGEGERLAAEPAADPPLPGEIRVLEGDAESADPLLACTAGALRALLWLAPAAPGRLPLATLRALLAAGSTELLLRFPVDDLRKLVRHGTSSLADLPPPARRVVEGYSRLVGDARHEWVFRWRAALAEGGEPAGERALLDYLVERLRGAAGERVLKPLVLPPVGEGAPEYLLLAAEPLRALQLNRAVHAARSAGHLPWEEAPDAAVVRYLPSSVLELFAGGAAAAEQRVRQVDVPALAHDLATRYAGRSLPVGELMADLAGSDLFPEDVRRALAELRREGRALYRSLADRAATVAFPRGGSPAPRRAGRARRADPEELSFPLDEAGGTGVP